MEVNAKFGFLIPHSTSIGNIPQQHAFGGELSYLIIPKHEKKWHLIRKNPLIGVSALFSSPG